MNNFLRSQLNFLISPAGLPFVGAGLLIIIILIAAIWIIVRRLRENEILKNEFITIIAHKFRTPLTQTRWLSEELVSAEQDSFKLESLKQIRQANQGLIDLTGTLIELTDSDTSSKLSYVFERIDLCDLVRSVGNALKTLFKEKNIFFSVQCPPEQIFVKVDRSRLEFVIQTLLTNASTYTPPGRNVTVTVTPAKGKALVTVIDNGIGIDPKDMSHLFSKFYRAPNAQRMDTEGFGIGLYLAQAVIRRHHGKLQAFSEGMGKGSTFQITLPAVR